MNLKRFIDDEITYEEALELTKLSGVKLMELYSVANEIREKYCGDKIALCTITNAKSGLCSENCKFCAQSAHYSTGVKTYPLKEKNILNEEYKRSEGLGSSKFGIVTSGRSIKKGSQEFEKIKEFIKDSNELGVDVEVCASIGLLSVEEIEELKNVGLTRIHNNLQTSIKSYSKLVATSHTIDNRIQTIKNGKKAGVEVCSGGIIGLGETWQDRIEMAFSLKELDVDGIPLNVLNPICGTPLENQEELSITDILKTIAIYRIIHKDKVIKLAAGREGRLKDFMGMAFMCGANGMLIGGYLTLRGRSVLEDKKFIQDIKKMWAK